MELTQLSEDDIAFIGELARQAGQTALDMRNSVEIRTKSGPNDFVTDADTAISRMLVQALSERFPEDLVLSEEDMHQLHDGQPVAERRLWLIDPIDGTENYIKRDGQHTAMIGLLVNGQPYYGWIYQPTTKTLFSGGPQFGSQKTACGGKPHQYRQLAPLENRSPIRLMMGWGDRRRHPWVMNLPNVQFVRSESLGLKIIKVLEDQADVFVSLTGRVKLWDTAAPAAIALGAHLDAGTVEGQPLPYPLPHTQHGSSVIIGRPGAIAWAQKYIAGHATYSVPKASQ